MPNVLHGGAKFSCSVCGAKAAVEAGKASGGSLSVAGKALVLKDDLMNLDLSACNNKQAPCSAVTVVLLGEAGRLKLAQGEAMSDAVIIVASPSGMLRFSGYNNEPARVLSLGGALVGSPLQSLSTPGNIAVSQLTVAEVAQKPATGPSPVTRMPWPRKSAPACARAYWDWTFVGAESGDIRLPMQQARCADLRVLMSEIDHKRKLLHTNPERAIDDGWKPFLEKRNAYLARLDQAEEALRKAELHVAVSSLGLALDASLLILGAVVTGPMGFATLVAASILLGPTKLGVQLFLKLDEPTPLIVAYSGQRVLMLTDLVGNGGPSLPAAGGRIGAVLGPIARAVAILWSVKDAATDGFDTYSTWHDVEAAKDILRRLDRDVEPLTRDPMAWVRHQDEAFGRTLGMLAHYAEATQATDCAFSDRPPVRQKLP